MELLALGSRPSNDQINYDGLVPAPPLVWTEKPSTISWTECQKGNR